MLVSQDEPRCTATPSRPECSSQNDHTLIEGILRLVRQQTGVDFAQYRRPTISRRIHNRMLSIGVRSLQDYWARWQADEAESMRLLERLTIKVSRFYRNACTFDVLAEEVLPWLACRRQPLRIWSAGCGCGEEAYTLAMLLEAARLPGKVEASDIDPAALAVAREGVYRREAFDELPAGLAAQLEAAGAQRYRVPAAARERVRFFRHDLGDAPPPAARFYDLICCRNVLIYFEREAQRRAFATLDEALRVDGYLCLGEAEWPLPEYVERYAPCGAKTQVFRRLQGGREGER